MKTITGDLVAMAAQGNFNIIVQGCNCFHTMGGGIARQISQQYPEVLAADKATLRGDRGKLGSLTTAFTRDQFLVVNAYTQYHFGEDPAAKDGVLVDYEAVRKAFRMVKQMHGGHGHLFGIPKIGAGLARGDWSVLEKIIDEEMAGEDLTLVLLPPKRGYK